MNGGPWLNVRVSFALVEGETLTALERLQPSKGFASPTNLL